MKMARAADHLRFSALVAAALGLLGGPSLAQSDSRVANQTSLGGTSQQVAPLSKRGRLTYDAAAVAGTDGFADNIASGAISLKAAITIKSTVPATSTIMCSLEVKLLRYSGSSYEADTLDRIETRTAPATRSSNTAACTVYLPFSWGMSDPADYYVDVSTHVYTVNESPAAIFRSQHRQWRTVGVQQLMLQPTFFVNIAPTL
jgi:hypothetical protein